MRRSLSETWMFSVVFWILCSWLPCLADWQVSCSRYVVQLQQNICHQNDCEHEWQSEEDLGSEQNFLRRDEHRRPDSQVLCLTALAWYTKLCWQSWIQLVVWRQPMKLTQNRCDVCSRRLAPVISLAAAFWIRFLPLTAQKPPWSRKTTKKDAA